MKQLFILLILLTSFSVNAAGVNVSGLTEEDAALVQLQVAQMKKAAASPDVTTAKQVSEWVEISQGLGSGINVLVKELGVTVNDFATSPVGVFSVFLIAWTVVGKSIVGVIFGTFWIIFGSMAWIRMYRKKFVIESEIFYDKGRDDKKRKEIKYQGKDNIPEATSFFYWFTLVLIVGVGLLTIFLS